MIRRPRGYPVPKVTSELPLCVNTFNYNESSGSTTDPGEPLPSGVNLTVNAPMKLGFPALGVSGFTASGNSYGVTPLYPELPFTVTNPMRIQIKGVGTVYWGKAGVSDRKEVSSVTDVSVTRASNSPSTTFTTPASLLNSDVLGPKLIKSGYYLRSDRPYLLAVYGKLFNDALPTFLLVYGAVKLLPQVFNLTGLVFKPFNQYRLYDTETSTTVAADECTTLDQVIERRDVQFTCSTSARVLDTDNIVEELFPLYRLTQTAGSGYPKYVQQYQLMVGVTSLAFTL